MCALVTGVQTCALPIYAHQVLGIPCASPGTRIAFTLAETDRRNQSDAPQSHRGCEHRELDPAGEPAADLLHRRPPAPPRPTRPREFRPLQPAVPRPPAHRFGSSRADPHPAAPPPPT